MESVNKKVILAAVIMALITSVLIYMYIKKATTSIDTVEYTKVYVAAKTLPARNKITDSDLKELKITKDFLNSKAVLNKSDIVGKRLKDRVIEGEQILGDRLISNSEDILSFDVPKGKRAVSINVNEQVEVADLIRPGDFVDVIGSFEKEEIDDKTNKVIYPRITKIILQNVQILALGQEQTVGDEKAKELPKTVTIAVSPEDSEKLVFASEYGVLRLALRGVDDKANVDTQGVIRGDLLPDKGVQIVPNSGK
jgi:pilus assembly protein CpaB